MSRYLDKLRRDSATGTENMNGKVGSRVPRKTFFKHPIQTVDPTPLQMALFHHFLLPRRDLVTKLLMPTMDPILHALLVFPVETITHNPLLLHILPLRQLESPSDKV